MKQKIHPKYYPNAKITCTCGAVYEVGSTVPEMHVEICANCHPFYTGKQKYIDTGGRVERYQRIFEKSKIIKNRKKKEKNVKAEKKQQGKKSSSRQSAKEMEKSKKEK